MHEGPDILRCQDLHFVHQLRERQLMCTTAVLHDCTAISGLCSQAGAAVLHGHELGHKSSSKQPGSDGNALELAA